jgi:NADP-dependent 3-hydroxy acid dehydrogenase YdfG
MGLSGEYAMSRVKGLTAVVTGAGRGLGAALAMTLADAGCRVVLCGRQEIALSVIAAMIADRTGVKPGMVCVDMADAASVAAAVATITEQYKTVDIVVNNAAMWLEATSTPHTPEEVASVVNAAVTGTYLFTQGFLPLLQQSRAPDIVTIGSVSGLPNAALQTVSVPFYAAKHAQAAIADGLRQLLAGTPIRSLIVHPPYLDDMLPGDPLWDVAPERTKGQRATNRDVVESVMFAVTRPRHISLSVVIDADDGGLHPR